MSLWFEIAIVVLLFLIFVATPVTVSLSIPQGVWKEINITLRQIRDELEKIRKALEEK